VADPFGGGTFLADTSAWARTRHARVASRWATALRNRQIATCPIVNLELLYTARTGEDFDEWSAELAQLRDIPITRSVTNAAQQAFRELAHAQPAYQRSVKIADLLVAACAQDAGVGVLHYDEDFDRLATVLSFEGRWIARAGSL
jgi:predicted nucleic acid-binding protein